MKTIWYLATPYSKYPGGPDAAFVFASMQLGLFVQARIPAFSPIVHTHPVAKYCAIDGDSANSIWTDADAHFIDMCGGMIVIHGTSWELSIGIQRERNEFLKQGKPVLEMEPYIIPPALFGV